MDPEPEIDAPALRVQRIARIRLVVADLQAACVFYEDALGFEVISRMDASVVLRLGAQEIELWAPAPSGRPYPKPRAANDPWFQHFAIAVSDMSAAYARLRRYAHEAISRGGPQLLPPSTGSVTAYKFRDPDGHPLELSHIPEGPWARRGGTGPFLGVDHTALAVRDLEGSVAFYTKVLGFSLGGRFLNHGAEQDRLDGLQGVQLDIVTLTTAAPGPHVELLHYREPGDIDPPPEIRPNDIVATRTVLNIASNGRLAALLEEKGWPYRAGEAEITVADPDGHQIELHET